MNYVVTENGKELPVKTARVYPCPYHRTQLMEYVQCFPEFPVCLRIRSEKKVQSAVVRPMSLGLTVEYENKEMLLRLDRPLKCSLEINGTAEDNLLILAEKKTDERPVTDEHLVFFPPGVHRADIVTVDRDNTTVYLEEGAYIHGKFSIRDCSHVKICGYGVISMEEYPVETRPLYARCIDVTGCCDVLIRDITIMDSNDWSLRICGCEDVTVDNVKIFGCRGNSDGVDVCGSKRVLVQNVFTRVWDDSLVVKALDTGDVEDVLFRRCILWNDFARPMEVGVELRADQVHRVRFEDIDIIHSSTGYPLMGIHHGDRAVVSDITFENIRIEDAPGAQLFDIRITPSFWNRDKKMGCIRNIRFKDICLRGKPGIELLLSESRLQGYSPEHDICGVSFENISLCGKTPGDTGALGLKCQDYVQDIRVSPAPGIPSLEPVGTELTVKEPFQLREDGFYEGILEVLLTNHAGDEREKEVWLKISPEHAGAYRRTRQKVYLPSEGEVRLEYSVVLQPGKYVAALQSDDPEIQYVWKFLELDWYLADTGVSRPLEFVNYCGQKLGGVRAWVEEESLVLESPLLLRKDCTFVLYTAAPVRRQPEEVVFSVEETDFGQVPAVIEGNHGLETAPQLRCPLEITLVFKNEPKVGEIHTFTIKGGENERLLIPLEELGLSGKDRHFWMEIEARLPEVEKLRYPYTLFHSVSPLTTAHMYGNCRIMKKGERYDTI